MNLKTGVLVVGGGPVGLAAALFLQKHKLPFILVERDVTESILPRARGWHLRTLELLRQVGLEDAAQAAAKAAWEQGGFGGARHGATMLSSKALELPPKEEMAAMLGKEPSPSTFCACPQSTFDPLLSRALQERGADLRYGWQLIGLSQDGAGVQAHVRDERANKLDISAEYLIAADGGRSFVRRELGIGSTYQTTAEKHYLNLFFRADLAALVEGRTFSQCEISNDQVRGIFLSKNNTTEWSFHLEYDPLQPDATQRTNEELIRAIRSAIGDFSGPIELLAKTTWSTGVRVADSYRSGRVFLAGDAAHTMPPWGGLNGNTGIADAHNLVWKLAAVMRDGADPVLLKSYQVERRPVAIRNGKQALLRTDLEARFEIATEANREVFQQLVSLGTLQLKYRYGCSDEQEGGTVEKLAGQPGTRFPHAWIVCGGKRMSTLDLFGEEYVFLQSPTSNMSPQDIADVYGAVPCRSYRVGTDFSFEEPLQTWSSLVEHAEREDVLVRPDGFVAYSSAPSLSPINAAVGR